MSYNGWEIVELWFYGNIQIKDVRLFKSILNQSCKNVAISTMPFFAKNDITSILIIGE